MYSGADIARPHLIVQWVRRSLGLDPLPVFVMQWHREQAGRVLEALRERPDLRVLGRG